MDLNMSNHNLSLPAEAYQFYTRHLLYTAKKANKRFGVIRSRYRLNKILEKLQQQGRRISYGIDGSVMACINEYFNGPQ